MRSYVVVVATLFLAVIVLLNLQQWKLVECYASGSSSLTPSTHEGAAPATGLEYAPWLIASSEGVCQPPEGVPKRCCLGSSSAGGGVNWDQHYYSPVLAPPSSPTVVTFILAALGSRSMAFVGDSMMYQTAVGFECAALCEAEGWAIEKHTEKRREKKRWRYGIGNVEEWEFKRGDQARNISFYSIYRFNETLVDIDEALASSEVVVANFGIHWMDSMEYREAISSLLAHLLPHASTHTIVWKESYSQHHDNEGGEYKSAGNKVKTKNCVDVVYGDRFSHMWRDVIVRDVALGLGFDIVWLNETSNGAEKKPERPLYWLPALEMSRSWAPFHKVNNNNNASSCEATHVCHTPYLWAPIWEYLKEAVEISGENEFKEQ